MPNTCFSIIQRRTASFTPKKKRKERYLFFLSEGKKTNTHSFDYNTTRWKGKRDKRIEMYHAKEGREEKQKRGKEERCLIIFQGRKDYSFQRL